MRATAIRSLVILPRELVKNAAKVIPPIKPHHPELRTTVHDILLDRKAKAGTSWPQNLRIEPVITRATFRSTGKKYIAPLKQFVERES
jgi:hypothetical protein